MTAAMMTRFPQLGLQKFHGGDEARERQSKGPGWQQCQFYRGPRPRRENLASTGVYFCTKRQQWQFYRRKYILATSVLSDVLNISTK